MQLKNAVITNSYKIDLDYREKKSKRKCIFYTNEVFQSDPPTYTPISSGIKANVTLMFQQQR